MLGNIGEALSPTELDDLCKEADATGSGKIMFEEVRRRSVFKLPVRPVHALGQPSTWPASKVFSAFHAFQPILHHEFKAVLNSPNPNLSKWTSSLIPHPPAFSQFVKMMLAK